MVTLNENIRVRNDVVDTKMDSGEIVLLQLETKMYYSLNATGARIWSGLKQGLSLAKISQRLQDEFEVDTERAERSVIALVGELIDQRLLENPSL